MEEPVEIAKEFLEAFACYLSYWPCGHEEHCELGGYCAVIEFCRDHSSMEIVRLLRGGHGSGSPMPPERSGVPPSPGEQPEGSSTGTPTGQPAADQKR